MNGPGRREGYEETGTMGTAWTASISQRLRMREIDAESVSRSEVKGSAKGQPSKDVDGYAWDCYASSC